MAKTDIYVATATFATEHDGDRVTVRAGLTRVRAGHPILKGREDKFKLLDVQFDVETARQAPGERRAAKKATARTDG